MVTFPCSSQFKYIKGDSKLSADKRHGLLGVAGFSSGDDSVTDFTAIIDSASSCTFMGEFNL